MMAEFGIMIGDSARRRSATDLDRRLARLERGGSPVSQAPSGVATSPKFHGVPSLVFTMSRAQSSAGTRCEQTAKLSV